MQNKPEADVHNAQHGVHKGGSDTAWLPPFALMV